MLDVFFFLVIFFLILLSFLRLGGKSSKEFMSVGFFFLAWSVFYYLSPFFSESVREPWWYYTVFVVVVYLFFFAVGTYAGSQKGVSVVAALFRVDGGGGQASYRSVLIVALAIDVVITYLSYGTFNLLDALAMRVEIRASKDWSGTSAYFDYFFNYFFRVLYCYLLLMIFRFQNGWFFNLVCVLVIMYLSLFSGSKYALVWIFLYLALLNFSRQKPPIGRLTLFLFLFLFSALIPIINIARSGGSGFKLQHLLLVLSDRSDLFPNLREMIHRLHTGVLDYSLGESIFAVFFRFLPRSVVPERMGSTDVELTKLMYGDVIWSLNLGGIGEFYFNFGLLGVVFISFFSGLLLRHVHLILVECKRMGNYFLLASLVASPFWHMPWGIGFNNLFTQHFIFWLVAVLVSVVLFRLLFYRKIWRSGENIIRHE